MNINDDDPKRKPLLTRLRELLAPPSVPVSLRNIAIALLNLEGFQPDYIENTPDGRMIVVLRKANPEDRITDAIEAPPFGVRYFALSDQDYLWHKLRFLRAQGMLATDEATLTFAVQLNLLAGVCDYFQGKTDSAERIITEVVKEWRMSGLKYEIKETVASGFKLEGGSKYLTGPLICLYSPQAPGEAPFDPDVRPYGVMRTLLGGSLEKITLVAPLPEIKPDESFGPDDLERMKVRWKELGSLARHETSRGQKLITELDNQAPPEPIDGGGVVKESFFGKRPQEGHKALDSGKPDDVN